MLPQKYEDGLGEQQGELISGEKISLPVSISPTSVRLPYKGRQFPLIELRKGD
jgi:hypothetical protein